jgi:hypothetical protein
MATRQAAGHKQRVNLGRAFVTGGLAVLLADLAFLAQPLEKLVERLRDGLFGFVPADGLLLTHLPYLGIILSHDRHNRGVCPAKIAHRPSGSRAMARIHIW